MTQHASAPRMTPRLPWIAALVALLAASALVWGGMDRWLPAGSQLLADPGFATVAAGVPQGWSARAGQGSITVAGDAVTLTSPAPLRAVVLEQRLPVDRHRAFRVEADVGIADVVAGPDASRWNAARVMLVGYRADGTPDFDRWGDLFRATGSAGSGWHATTIVLGGDAVEARLMLRLDRVSGAMTVRAPAVFPVDPRLAYRLASGLLGAVWAMVLAVAAWLFLRTAASRPAALVVLAVMAAGGVLNLVQSDLTVPLFRAMQERSGDLLDQQTFDRLAHALGFVLLTVAWRRARPGEGWTAMLGSLVLLAAASELMQGISGDLGLDDVTDAAINMAGVALGAVIAWVLKRNEGA